MSVPNSQSVVVPVELTREMLEAGAACLGRGSDTGPYEARGRAIDAWTAMLAAAPQQSGPDDVVVPKELTDDMAVAFCEVWFSKVRAIDDPEMEDAYRALLAAAPSATPGVSDG